MKRSPIPGTRGFALAALWIAALSQVAAQAPSSDPPPVEIKTLPRTFVKDELRLWTSPFRSSSYESHALTKYVIPFALISGALIATDHKTGNLLPNTPDQEIWSGRVSQFGAAYSLAGISGATYLVGLLGGDAHARETGLLGMEALGHTQIVVFAFKEITNRERPLDGVGDFWGGGASFPSGHAASSFALATVFAYEYSDHLAVPITAYALAGAVSASRLSARQHWVSDIAVGGSVGFLIGRFTYKRNHDSGLPGSPVVRSGRLIPEVGVSGSSVVLSWQL